MKIRIVSILVPLGMAIVGTLLPACSRSASNDGRMSVVAAFYPLAEAATVVGGDRVDVLNLTPPGVEPHDLELAPDRIADIQEADVVLYLGNGFAPAVEQAVVGAKGMEVNLLSGLERGNDPHVWLDPTIYRVIVERTRAALTEASPADAVRFQANAQGFEHQLTRLDADYRSGLATCRRHLIVTSHDAFGYLAARYGLTQEAIAGLSPDAEPTPDRLAALTALARQQGATTIFTEELVSPKVADTLAREAGLTTAVLNPLEGLTEQEEQRGADYLSIMRSNLRTLQEALGCAHA